MTSRDRRTAIIQSPEFNGIDFVEIADPSQTVLRVHFLNALPLGALPSLPLIQGGETIPTVAVEPIKPGDWGYDEGHLVLTLRVGAPGDFSTYTLSIASPVLDPFFDHVAFSFKALCPSDLDCEAPAPPCPPLAGNPPPIEYLAKDFLSFRQALLDFSTLRYPQWQERSEGDFGMMFLEALSALADDLSYTQDRVAAEAALVTATQRRSVVRHARLVDYEPGPALSASVLLQFDVAPGVAELPDGLQVIAQGPDGSPTFFETGTSLVERMIDPATGALRTAPPQTTVSALWNSGRLQPYWFDDSQQCLMAGATHMHLLGRGYDFQPGQMLLIETQGATTADPPIRQIVTLTGASEVCDEVFTRPADNSPSPPFMTCPVSPPAAMAPTAVTRIAWGTADAIAVNRDLTKTVLAGNILPATQGRTVLNEQFAITAAAPGDLTTPPSVVRVGARSTQPDGTPGTTMPLQMYSLTGGAVAWLPPPAGDTTDPPQPEILLLQQTDTGGQILWGWNQQLVEAGEFDTAYTLDPAVYTPILRNSDNTLQYEYGGDTGDTIRFGGNGFAITPDDGTYFAASYRVGAGAAGNVAANAISRVAPDQAAGAGVMAVTNPLPASGGADPETITSVQLLAPQAFRAVQYRAVIPADYEAAAETLSWVERAGTVFRWTGSWLTVFTTPEPLATEEATIDERIELITLLNRYRMAGYESYVPDPDYVSIDLAIQLCAAFDAYQGDVETAVLAALNPLGQSGKPGFFAHDNFTFGQALERSALEAAIQNAPGVAGVTCIDYRVRGRIGAMAEMPDYVSVGADQIIRCDNDPSVPEHGSISVTVSGGK